jgi:deoxyribonuclease IV
MTLLIRVYPRNSAATLPLLSVQPPWPSVVILPFLDCPMLGSHLSISNGLPAAAREAEWLGLDTVQVFTKNQQQWLVKPLDESIVAEWRAELKRLAWLDRTVSHASYLANMASVNDELFAKSVDLMTVELERCEQLSIPYLVQHPGSFVGWTLDQGLARIIAGCCEILRRTKGHKTVLCLEGTAGAGSHVGGDFAHLAALRDGILQAGADPARIGFCLDTCHLHVAGYDMSTRASAAKVLEEFDQRCGLKHIKVWHLNDSKGKLGSHLDRHDHIGLGHVAGNPPAHSKPAKTDKPDAAPKFSAKRAADSAFAAIMNHPAFKNVPKIMETPKEDPPKTKSATPIPKAKRLDTINAARLRAMISA